ncbi:UDP-glucose 4-epimerase GalE [Sphingomonas sp. MA1305]|uniref:UDP-glucose 4-epimerase GalE n=1 Tax=Sphingomonas sp. MA1305 TaxID=2479204 RepID=UPI0018E012AA|nr:UDP-glucose 4-epimerase GalE [Sphingomonas sp. MA1305]MBI0477194.1 UDP-glucose 4-epimerase GalE [Sphingomonas sp. MA1305]
MRVLVTGGAGYIGSHTCKALALAGHKPIVFDNLSTGHRRSVKWGDFIHGDITDPTAMGEALAASRADAVIHFAASAYVGESMRLPRHYYRNNVVGTLSLLDAMAARGMRRLIFSSSCATYGVPETLPINEMARQAPINPYGDSKLVCESMARAAATADGLSCIALRYFNACGADPEGEIGEDHDPETHVIPLILRSAAGGPAFTIFGTDYPTPDGTCIRDYLHVSDLADAHVRALDHLSEYAGFEALNLGTGHGHSVREIVHVVEQRLGRPLDLRQAERRPGDPPELVADARRAAATFGWTPRYSNLSTIIDTAWSWMNAQVTS